MTISVITLFPEMFTGILNSSILKRAQVKGKVGIELINLRDFGIGKHKVVDDKPYGGGAGMVLRVDVMEKAITHAKKKAPGAKVILLDPRGIPYSQAVAENLSNKKNIILICGHYEGFDERIRAYADIEVSIGDYILTGGEIPAMAVIDSVVRLVPGVLGKKESHLFDSFSKTDNGRVLEHPHYTRPEVYQKKRVPKVLLSGDPKKVEEFRAKSALAETEQNRKDLLKSVSR